jgi:hypothetical protein
MIQEMKAEGSITGITGTAITVHLGFVPRYVACYNVSDATLPRLFWFKGMAAASGYKEVITGGTYIVPSILSSGGITAYAGSAPTDGVTESDTAGFIFGTDSDLNGTGDTIFYVAVR